MPGGIGFATAFVSDLAHVLGFHRDIDAVRQAVLRVGGHLGGHGAAGAEQQGGRHSSQQKGGALERQNGSADSKRSESLVDECSIFGATDLKTRQIHTGCRFGEKIT